MLTRRNVAFNAAGIVVPLIAAVASIPLLISHLGLERFGVLSVLLAVMSYVAVLDFGLGSAVTYKLAPMMVQGNTADKAVLEIIETTIAATLLIAAVVALLLLSTAAWISPLIRPASETLATETVQSVRVLALGLPAIFGTSALTGILSAAGRFDEINKVRIPMGAASYLAPALASLYTTDLRVVVLVLCLVRTCGALIHVFQCRNLCPELFSRVPTVSFAILKGMLHFGGWMTVSNLVGPFMVYMDRFYIGAVRSAADVARYVTPYEVATKLTLIPASVLPILFPMFISRWSEPNGSAGRLTVDAAAWTALGCVVPAAVLAVFSPQLLQAWLGPEFAQDSALVMQILAGGVLANCVAQVFFVQIQSSGRTDIIAKIHLCELAGYGLLLWFLTQRFGIVGVAAAWTLRVVVDGGLFCWMAGKRLTNSERTECWLIYLGTAVFALGLSMIGLVEAWLHRAVAVVVAFAVVWLLSKKRGPLFAAH